ncbi:YgfZ/GcvT domain-containing protein [Tepidamorphus sp. 3E244]|uniref:CAF17-like 4Fe-4S cluster assembly/insertion protein YgfZ n=1 Tax=Tepidamorphus sp. 3E244 TaxID=3385498 RepID=UPI0038FC0F58
MTDSQTIRLGDRAILRVAGPDARHLLQGLLTCEIDALEPAAPAHGALLTPQGKILFEAIVHAEGEDSILLDTCAELADDFAKRLTFYKLRAKATIERADELCAVALPGGVAEGLAPDPRLFTLGHRGIVELTQAETLSDDIAPYHAHRIHEGIAELGADFVTGDVFPHEANFDHYAGVSFSKGCFVGQEVVSRMQHRGTARKRFVSVAIDGTAPAMGSDVKADEKSVGTMGSASAAQGLALLRLDRINKAESVGDALTCEGATLTPSVPEWMAQALAKSGETA